MIKHLTINSYKSITLPSSIETFGDSFLFGAFMYLMEVHLFFFIFIFNSFVSIATDVFGMLDSNLNPGE